MKLNIRNRIYAFLCLFLISAGVGHAVESSPEALGMRFADAFRAGNLNTMLDMMHVEDDTIQSATEKRAQLLRHWRRLLDDYRLTGYRVDTVPARERAALKSLHADGRPVRLSLSPIKKLELQLQSRSGREALIQVLYIGRLGQDYRFAAP